MLLHWHLFFRLLYQLTYLTHHTWISNKVDFPLRRTREEQIEFGQSNLNVKATSPPVSAHLIYGHTGVGQV